MRRHLREDGPGDLIPLLQWAHRLESDENAVMPVGRVIDMT